MGIYLQVFNTRYIPDETRTKRWFSKRSKPKTSWLHYSSPLAGETVLHARKMRGLSKHLFYEDLIAEQAGFEVEAVERPYTTFQLIDPHVQAFRVNLEDVASQLQKREESRRLWENIKRAAAEGGVTPGEVVVGMGLHRNKSPVAT